MKINLIHRSAFSVTHGIVGTCPGILLRVVVVLRATYSM